MTVKSTVEPQGQALVAPGSGNSQPSHQGTAGAYYNSPPAYPESQPRSSPEYGNEQMTRSYVDERGEKKSNKAGTVGGGVLGYLLTGQLTGAAGGAILGNMYSKHRKYVPLQRRYCFNYVPVLTRLMKLTTAGRRRNRADSINLHG